MRISKVLVFIFWVETAAGVVSGVAKIRELGVRAVVLIWTDVRPALMVAIPALAERASDVSICIFTVVIIPFVNRFPLVSIARVLRVKGPVRVDITTVKIQIDTSD